ncbi:MAG TPA: lipase maturation factor family protein, partial [Terracidiphilus sp.]
PARDYLSALAGAMGAERYWVAPSLFWLSTSSHAMVAVTWIGLLASLAAFLNLWPRLTFFVCWVCFLSFVTTSQVFSSYQSDGMLLEAGFIVLFFAPRGFLPGWGADSPPSRASHFLLQWEWFRIYFESGLVKLLSGDPEWRHLTAMDDYYQNGPLPTWIGWYVQHWPHWFQVFTAGATLAMELGLVWMLFFPRRVRIICFCIVTPWEIGVILTANYTFLNYLVLSLGFLLLDDRALTWLVPVRRRPDEPTPAPEFESHEEAPPSILAVPERSLAATESTKKSAALQGQDFGGAEIESTPTGSSATEGVSARTPNWRRRVARHFRALGLAFSALMLTWIAFDTTVELIAMPARGIPSILTLPVQALDPLRIANQYGLFAVMTRGRYEIEFQGSNDGTTWTPYLFQHKPQALNQAPGIYAPYQPRFDWNLWFASLADWQQNENLVPLTEERLLVGDPAVLSLFKRNPFPQAPPRYIRAVLWQYWFTSMAQKRQTGDWWRRQFLGLYAPELIIIPGGRFAVVEWPPDLPPHE